jgi:signal transduction histidine kinase
VTGPRSLRRRITVAFAVFAVVLIGVLLLSFDSVLHVTEDTVLQSQLELEAERLRARSDLLAEPVIEVDRRVTAYVGLAAAPAELAPRLANLEPGTHELGGFLDRVQEEEIHVRVASMDGRAELLYLVYDATSPSDARLIGPVYASAVVMGLLLAGLIGAMTGRLVAGLVIRPVVSLADEVRTGSLETLTERIDPGDYGEEVGVLAEALAEAAGRLRGFVVRERQFTANASHELRNPITVIRGAAELLEGKIDGGSPALVEPVARIQRAVAAMEETIEVFLALAREGELAVPDASCSLREVVDEVVEQNRRLLQGKPVGVKVEVPGTVHVQAPRRVLAIVLGNLVGNAFRRTLRGAVTIGWHQDHLEVRDTGPGIPQEIVASAGRRHVASEPGHGLGLSIVSALCERVGWQLDLDSCEGSGSCATLIL